MIHMHIWIPDPLAEHIDLILSSQLTFYYKDQQITVYSLQASSGSPPVFVWFVKQGWFLHF